MKVSFGFILLIVGILGIARAGIDAPQQNLGQVIGTGPGLVSLVTLAAVFLLVGGLLILASAGRFSSEGFRGHVRTDAAGDAPPIGAADVHATNKNT